MTVADLQRYLHSLADAVAASPQAEPAARELRDASAALGAFAPLTLAELADFLAAAWRYKMSGEVAAPKPAPRTVLLADRGPEDLAAVVAALLDPAATPAATPVSVRDELRAFRHLSAGQLAAVAVSVGVTPVPRMAYRALDAVAERITARRFPGSAGSGPRPPAGEPTRDPAEGE